MITPSRLLGIAVLTCLIFTSTSAKADLCIFEENFDSQTDGFVTREGRVWDNNLDSGWKSTTGWGDPAYPSNWEFSGGQVQNATSVAPTLPRQTAESETPVWNWFTNPETSNTSTTIDVQFDYMVDAGDTVHMHLWGVQQGGTATTTKTWFTNNQGWTNGNSSQNEITSAGGNTAYNLTDGSNAPTTGSLSGALSGMGTYTTSIDVSTLAIPGVSTVGDFDTFFIAFSINETGGGTTKIDNIKLSSPDAVPEPSSLFVLGLACTGLAIRRRRS